MKKWIASLLAVVLSGLMIPALSLYAKEGEKPANGFEKSAALGTMQIPAVTAPCLDQCKKENMKTRQISLFQSPKPYSQGTLIGYSLDDTLLMEIDGQTYHVHPTCVAVSQEEKDALKDYQKKEADREKRRLDAEMKVSQAKNASQPAGTMADLEEEDLEIKLDTPQWNGAVLNRSAGTIMGPSGKETYYNLPMDGVVRIMRSIGNNDKYWVREDGVKMLGDYVMVAAHLPTRPRGSLIQTSLGMGIVCDTGTFALNNHTQLDIAVNW